MKKHLLSLTAAASLGLAAAGASAAPLLDFTVNEGSVPGNAVPIEFVADKMNGAYTEILTINNDFTFDTAAYANFGQFLANDGNTLVAPLQLNGVNGYGLYALFSSSGSVAGGTFTGTSGRFDLYIDTNQDTTLDVGANGTSAIDVGANSDDYRIAFTTSLTSAIGIIGNPGAFDLFFDSFTLTGGDQNAVLAGDQNGENYFTSPRPFHLLVNVDGDFDNFVIAPGNIDVTGDLSAVFVVPEPGSLALVGLALAGLGLSARRRNG